jgi:hypothetical protein
VKSAVASSRIAEATARPGLRENNARVDPVVTADCGFASCEVQSDTARILPASTDVKFSPLEFMMLLFKETGIKQLMDSCAQIPLTRASLLSDISYVDHKTFIQLLVNLFQRNGCT